MDKYRTNNKKASVIVPVYNSQDTIIRCVESIIFGQFRDIEVVLIDDKSKDNSWDICNQLSEKYESVKCYQNEVNKGVSATRNIGLKHASGEYILFVDSDDWVSGNYADILLKTADENQDALVLCGLHFINYVDNYRQDFIWEKDGQNQITINNNKFFELVKKFHIQQLWNKVFKRAVIEKNNISFDESIKMGEDFQFVLDYMKAISCEKCIIINQPLYFYTRTNNNTLMSQFGLNGLQLEKKRYKELHVIAGSEATNDFDEAVKTVEYNHAYHIIKNQQIRRSNKNKIVKDIIQGERSREILRKIKTQVTKENLAAQKKKIKSLRNRILGKIQRIRNKRIIQREKQRFNYGKTLSIISQNCIGGVFYHDMGMEFASPTINLYFKAADFVRFISDLKHYMSVEPEMAWGEEFPIGYLEDVAIYFMHFSDCTDALDAWNRRKARIDWDNIFIFCTDMEGFSKKEFDIWSDVKYPKVLFTSNPDYCSSESTILIDKYKNCESVSDLIPEREFYASGKLLKMINNRTNKSEKS